MKHLLALSLLILSGCTGAAFQTGSEADRGPELPPGADQPGGASPEGGTIVSLTPPDAGPKGDSISATMTEPTLDAALPAAPDAPDAAPPPEESPEAAPPVLVDKTLFVIFDRTTYTAEEPVMGGDAGSLGVDIFKAGLKEFVANDAVPMALQYEPVATLRSQGVLAPSYDIADYASPAIPLGTAASDWALSLDVQASVTHGWTRSAIGVAARAAVAYLAARPQSRAGVVLFTRYSDSNLEFITALHNARIPFYVISAKGSQASTVTQIAFDSAPGEPYWCLSAEDVGLALHDVLQKL